MLRRYFLSPWRSEALLVAGLKTCATVAGIVVVLIFAFLLRESVPLMHQLTLSRFLFDESWHPTEQMFGIAPMIAGTFYVMMGAIILAAPIGIAVALFCEFYAPRWMARVLRLMLELLAGIPSVVFGFWGLMVLVPLIAEHSPPGPSLLAGVLILTIMTVPTVALLSGASVASVPTLYYRSALALGLSRWSTVWRVIIPAARAGFCTSVILAMGRALGETMAILMVAGNIVQVPRTIFQPVRTLTANIALEMAYAMGTHRAALFVSGLILLIMTAVLVLVSERLQRGLVDA